MIQNGLKNATKKIAVLFPGIGYTCDKPLLYYSGKIAAGHGYQVVTVPYGNFSGGIKGNPEKMKEAFFSALNQAEEILKDIQWEMYSEILFISKSVGTVVAAAYRNKHRLPAWSISFTPLEETFRFAEGEGIMFHGTADSWAKNSERIRELCKKIHQPLYLVEQGDHSLETGDICKDIETLKWIMEKVENAISTKEN